MAARSPARASRPPPCGPPPPHLRRRKNPCRLIRFKKNGAQILEERFNNGRHVWWVAGRRADGADREGLRRRRPAAIPPPMAYGPSRHQSRLASLKRPIFSGSVIL